MNFLKSVWNSKSNFRLRFKEQSKDYEDALEQEILEKDLKLNQYLNKIESLSDELKLFKEKVKRNEFEITNLQKEIDMLRLNLKQYDDQKRELEQLNDQWENSARYLEYTKQELEERLYHAEESAILFKGELDEISVQKEIEIQRLKDEIKDLKQELSLLATTNSNAGKIHELEEALNKALKRQKEQKADLKIARINKTTSTTSEQVEPTAAVRVIVKVRPFLDQDSSKTQCMVCNDSEVQIDSKRLGSAKCFMFEKVIGPDDSMEILFADLKNNIEYAAGGGNSCILAYGQTGSGKTYTMNGIISRAFKVLKQRFLGSHVSISIQCIEIYNEQVRNLLTNDPLSKNWNDILKMSEVKLSGDWVIKAKELIKKSCAKRQTKSTESNEMSSRSHCIYTVIFSLNGLSGQIQFVDLAGSERISKSKVTGDALKETLHINKSLSALQDVITALETKSEHIPYRNSLLTRMLKPTLGGSESKVTVILACSPSEDSVNETLSTLALGTRIKSVDLCWALKKNIKSIEVERTLSLLEKERSEKLALIRKLEKLDRDFQNYELGMKEKDLRIASMSVIIKQNEKKFMEQTETLKKEILNLKNRPEEPKKKSVVLISSADFDNAPKYSANQPEEVKKKPILALSAETDRLMKSSSCKNYKILDTNKRFISTSPHAVKKSIVPGQTGKSTTPSRPQKVLFIKSVTKNLIVKSRG